MTDKQPLAAHPISIQTAKELIGGPLGAVYREILMGSCAPILWWSRRTGTILHSATVTFVNTGRRLLGVTAAHVLRQHRLDVERDDSIVLQVFNTALSNFEQKIISLPEEGKVDIATFAVDDDILQRVGKTIIPLSWPPQVPQAGRAIMFAGYPKNEIYNTASGSANFGLFTAITIVRSVSDHQIIWMREDDDEVSGVSIATPAAHYDMGGVSGGPLLAISESENYIVTHTIAGIITEHPRYDKGVFPRERVVAARADHITDLGRVI